MRRIHAFCGLLLLSGVSAAAQSSARISIESGTSVPISISSTSNNTWRVGPNAAAVPGFVIFDGTAGLPRFTIDLSGRVGIGTGTPQAALDVAGAVRSASGGFVYPDGTVQMSAGTGTVYAAGAGLSLIGSTFSIQSAGVTSSMLGAEAVDTNAIANAAVTSAKLASSSVTSSAIASSAVQTAAIADGAVTAAKLAAGAAGGVERVVRGVVTIGGAMSTAYEVTATFSPSVDPAKSFVVLSTPVRGAYPNTVGWYYYDPPTGAAVVDLTSNSITIAINHPDRSTNNDEWQWPVRVSYQIIQFK